MGAVRAGLDFFLSAVKLAASLTDEDVTLALTWLTVVEISAIERQGSLESWVASSRPDLTDQERPPVRIVHLARLLAQPFETTRRHVHQLIEIGFLAKVRGGVISPGACLRSERVQAVGLQLQTLHRRCLLQAQSSGAIAVDGVSLNWLLADSAQASADPELRDMQCRYVRIAVDYLVQCAGLYAELAGNNLISGLAFIAIVQANLRAVRGSGELSRVYDRIASPVPDRLRQPVSVYALAKTLSLPYESARRHALRLEALGLVERRSEGLIVTSAMLSEPGMLAIITRLFGLFEESVRSLAANGLPIRLAA